MARRDEYGRTDARDAATAAMRVDLFLWFARLARTRATAQGIAEKGTLRIDGRRIDRAHAPVRVGCVLAFPLNGQVRVLRVEALPERRVSPAQTAALYTSLETLGAKGVDAPPARA